MAIKESLLHTIEVIGLFDYVRAVTMAGESRNVEVGQLAKTVIEDYITNISGEEKSVIEAIELDPEVIELYESLGWNQTPVESREALRSMAMPLLDEDEVISEEIEDLSEEEPEEIEEEITEPEPEEEDMR